MLTVIPRSAVRRSRRSLREWVQGALTDAPALLAVLADRYTQEAHLRPFAPLAERFAGRLEVIVAAEWDQDERETEGEALLLALGIGEEARHLLLHDEGPARHGIVLRQKQPVALIELFFAERGYTTLDGRPDPEAAAMRAREDAVARRLEQVLGPAPRILKPGEQRDRFELIELD